MKTVIKLPLQTTYDLPQEFQSDDTRSSELLVQYFVNKFTKEGDTVLDPFAGFGTTLYVSEKCKRIPYGVELDKARFEFIRSKIIHKDNIIQANWLDIDSVPFLDIDFCFTSPPYMNMKETSNPLTNYSSKATYDDYLDLMTKIFSRIKRSMKKDGILVIEVNNIKQEQITTLAWDIGKKLSNVFDFQGELIIVWDGISDEKGVYGTGYDHSYCLVYKNSY